MTRKIIVVLWTAVLLLTSCNLPAASKGAPQAWIDDPLDGMRLPLQPYTLTLHSSDPHGIAKMEVSVNGQVLATLSNPDPGQLLVYLTQQWVPSSPGRYIIRARTQNIGGTWSAEDLVTVEVEGTSTPTPVASMTASPTPVASVTASPTAVATVTASPTPVATVTSSPTAVTAPGLMILSVSTDQFYFGETSCGPTSVKLEVQISDGAQIHDVLLFFKLRDKDSGKYTAWNDGLVMRAQGNGRFAISLPSSSITGIASRDNWLIYQFVGTGADNKAVARSPVYSDISLTGCGRFILTAP